MRRALLKVAFAVAVVGLTFLLLTPAMIGLQALLARNFRPSSPYPAGGGAGLLPSIVLLALCMTVSDRIVSYLFRAGGLSDGQWSVMRDWPRRGKINRHMFRAKP